MTAAHVALVLGAVLLLLLAVGAGRLASRRSRRMSELSDLSRDDIDPEWERTRNTMTTPRRKPPRRHR